MKASKEQIKNWLDTQVGLTLAQHQTLVLTEIEDPFGDIMVPDVKLKNISTSDYIHLNSEALRLVAEVMELPITVIDRGDRCEDYDKLCRYELQFVYNGMKVIALESERDYEEVSKTDVDR